jgi:hypothetical protein
MNDAPMQPIYKKINEVSAAVEELATVGKRSELRKKAFEILVMLDEVRKAAHDMEEELIKLKYDYPAQRFERVKGVKRG